MNANELADALQETEPYYSTDYKLFDKAATMLRQQQAEIEALKAKEQKDYEIISDLLERNVALKAKTLTDEEISQVYKEVSEPFGEKRLYEIHDFARAILRKAQEK